jgi:hypothetical protein
MNIYEKPMRLGKKRFGATMFEHLFQGAIKKAEKAYQAIDKLGMKINPAKTEIKDGQSL